MNISETFLIKNVTVDKMQAPNRTSDSTSWQRSSPSMIAAFSMGSAFSMLGSIHNGILLIVLVRGLLLLKSGSQILVANLILIYMVEGLIGCTTVIEAMGLSVSPSLCTGLLFVGMADFTAGMWTNVFLCINRLVALYFPHHYMKIAGRTLNVVLSVLCWVLGFVLILPIVVTKENALTISNLTGLCEIEFTSPLMSILFVFMTVIPYMVIFGTSTAIIIKAYKTIHTAKQTNSNPNASARKDYQQFQRRLHLAKMLFYSFLWLTCSQLPSIIAHSAFADWIQKNPAGYSWLTTVLLAADNAVNPLIFFAMSKDYRTGLRSLCGWAWCSKNAVDPHSKTEKSDTLNQKGPLTYQTTQNTGAPPTRSGASTN